MPLNPFYVPGQCCQLISGCLGRCYQVVGSNQFKSISVISSSNMKPSSDIVELLMLVGVGSVSDSACSLVSGVGVSVGADAGCVAGPVPGAAGSDAGGACSEAGPVLSVGGGTTGGFVVGWSLPITCCSSLTELDRSISLVSTISENEDCWGPGGCP